MRCFEADGFVVDPAFSGGFADSLSGMRKVNIGCFDSGSIWRVDVFLATTPFVRSAFERRVSSVIEGMTLSVVTAEDLLLFKLIADRTKERLDVEDMLLVCGALDEAYLRHWASNLGVTERLERALRESRRR